jgi:hypothetical protein
VVRELKNKAGNRCGGYPALEAFSKTKKERVFFERVFSMLFSP